MEPSSAPTPMERYKASMASVAHRPTGPYQGREPPSPFPAHPEQAVHSEDDGETDEEPDDKYS